MEELKAFIERIEERRQKWEVEHKLRDIVEIVLLARLVKAEEFVEIEVFAEVKKGILSHDTIQREKSRIKPEVMKGLFEVWGKMSQEGEGERIKRMLNIYGKTIKGNGNKKQEAIHIVSEWSKEEGICFGQKAEEGNGNEIRAIKELLKVKGEIVTIDAIGAQKEKAKKIKEEGGDYVLALKSNQKRMYEEVKRYFEEGEFLERIEREEIYVEQVEKAHGQIEKREYYQTEV
ncbi:MAG: ISAs1 family transposase [Endomicrobium sp.]|jgi:predicted transposase YbfD/YdcC|nr:ISAs1 family transposase [Endomicrobium sp.]